VAFAFLRAFASSRSYSARSLAADRTSVQGKKDLAMRITRRFTKSGQDALASVRYEKRTSRITNPDGSVVFEMNDAEIPAQWSQLATDIMVSKYFRKAGVPQADPATGQPLRDAQGNIVTGPAQGHFYCDPGTGHLLKSQDAYTHPQPHACQPFHAPVSTPQGRFPIGKIVLEKLVGLEVFDGGDKGAGTTRVVAVKHNGRR